MEPNGTPPSPLRIARLSQGLRLVDVAQRAGVCTSYLSMIERGLTPPDPVRERVATALGREVDECWPGAS